MWNYFFRVCVLNRTSVYLHSFVYVMDHLRTAIFILAAVSAVSAWLCIAALAYRVSICTCFGELNNDYDEKTIL